MSRKTMVIATLAWALTACGALPSAQGVQKAVEQHTWCSAFSYQSPIWSHDGAHIIYVLYPQGGPPDIRIMDVDGSNDKRLVHDGDYPSLSPDGSLLLFERESPLNSPGYTPDAVRLVDFYLLDMTALTVRPLVQSMHFASWSPDGRWLAYGPPESQAGSLAKMEVSTAQVTKLTHAERKSGQFDTDPVWSPDGKSIAFASNRDGRKSVYLMDADPGEAGSGAHIIRLTTKNSECASPARDLGDEPLAWQPDGSVLAVAQVCDCCPSTRLLSRSGQEVAVWGGTLSLDLRWSPDGRHMTYLEAYGTGSREVIADGDGSNVQPFSQDVGYPAWSPDGTQIVANGFDARGYEQIFIMDQTGGSPRQITQNPSEGVCLH